MADTVEECERLRELLRTHGRHAPTCPKAARVADYRAGMPCNCGIDAALGDGKTVLAQSAREAELRSSQKAALDDILASIEDARRISPEWPAALWQGFNRIEAGVRAARKRVEPRDGEEGAGK
jgi:hypothetical protein